ncbi:MAG: hypothetical protein OEW19_01485 [Acidobacteriota bacterium]|nr:hypothetical protein [Acidobacteriota bacterium]
MLASLVVVWVGMLLALPPRPSAWLVFASGLPVVLMLSRRAARRRAADWPAFVRRTADLHALGLVLLYALGVQLADTHGVTTDGVTYFTQLRSLVFDRDLDVATEYAFLSQPARPNHVVPVGPLLIWAPLYLVVAAVDALGRLVGAWVGPAEPVGLGLGLPYVRAALVSSFAIGAAGLFAVQAHLRREFSHLVSVTATVLLFGATPLYWYMVYEPSMTHAASFGFVALFIVCAARWLQPADGTSWWRGSRLATSDSRLPPPDTRQSLLLGTLLGLAFLARSQESLFAIYPAMLVLTAAGVPGGERVRRALRLAGWAMLGALPWILFQLAHSYVLFSRYEYQLFGQSGYFNPWQSRWVDTLFSSWHGFLSWTPAAYVAVIGTVAYLRREWRWAAAALVILFLTAWVNGSTLDWAGGWSFGGRRFSSALVMLAPGLALVVEFALRRPMVMLAPLLVGALWWNHLLMVQYTAGMLPKDAPVSFGRLVRQQAELHTRSPYWYPFAFPANVWFAWREGVPVDKYDVLSPETPTVEFSTTFDRAADRYLLSGWDVPGGDDWGSSWWIGGSPAVMAVPLALEDRDVAITIRARTRFEEPPMQARLALDVNGQEVGRFDAGVPEATTVALQIPASAARRLFRRGFNQIGFRSLGVTPVDPSDPRPPGPLASRGPRAVWPVAVYSLEIR